MPRYNSDIRSDEQQMIRQALESLATSYSNDTLDGLLEKYNAIIEREGGQKVFWDFGVSRENRQVQDNNTLLEQAIDGRHYVTFSYRNAGGHISTQTVEPLAIHYKWYAWYLFAYSEAKEQYRTYKVARMEHILVDDRISRHDHGDVKQLMREYFPDCPVTQLPEKRCRMQIDVLAKERL